MSTLNVNCTSSVMFSGGTSLYVISLKHFGSMWHSLHVAFINAFRFIPTDHTTGLHITVFSQSELDFQTFALGLFDR